MTCGFSRRVIRKEAHASSVKGFETEGSREAVRFYMNAEKKALEATEREKKMMEILRADEKSRQESETKMLNRSLGIKMQEFEEEWLHKRKEMETHCASLLEAVNEKAEAQRHHFEEHVAAERIPPVKFSPLIRDMIKQGKKLAQAEMYNDVLLLHKRVEAGKMQEEESWKKSILDKQEVRRKQLEQKIAQEKRNVDEKITGIRSTFEKSYVNAKDVLMQNLKNLSTDMERAFAREWVARPELAISAKALGGQKYDIPSLTKLHFDDDELTGTADDARAIYKYDVHRMAKLGRPGRQETPKKEHKEEEETAGKGGEEERRHDVQTKIVTSVEELTE
ncbi:hypothetical protein GUITHDRAFT_114767 [Guillardia theta CCMP2712]|uniref:Uncharacterized protein n=1 Tax=Guillardia theta (strain CCMP2712) TaxID=905079 RepID=L1IS60_GUITC|nr:hypothetical protein GUITHDRAFT_114767 [Guillardia theta CCMP2712]EKX39106.1 hypothetical protein GUITHDRAFT_114767 [Guillardia theta CCMP2712]|eukprot:XP_005826086.1 hypothetical protein GUITHDRAFT_114767 [Guillardia theta CCMP2712]